MRTKQAFLLSTVLAGLIAAACSSSTTTSSGLAEDKKIAALDRAEEGTLCDYLAARFGGYGVEKTATCAGGASSKTSAPASQAACVDKFLEKVPDTCPMTVSQAEKCFTDLGAATCASSSGFPASCELLTEPICGPALTSVSGVVDAGPDDAGSDVGVVPVDAAPTNQCPSNTKQTSPIVSAACQSALEGECCAELTACFGIVPPGASDDCNKYAACIPRCRFKADGVTPETDNTLITACQDDCDLAATTSVISAYEAIVTCVTGHPKSNAACQ